MTSTSLSMLIAVWLCTVVTSMANSTMSTVSKEAEPNTEEAKANTQPIQRKHNYQLVAISAVTTFVTALLITAVVLGSIVYCRRRPNRANLGHLPTSDSRPTTDLTGLVGMTPGATAATSQDQQQQTSSESTASSK